MKKILYYIVLLTALAVFAFSGYQIFDYWRESKASSDLTGDLIEQAVTENKETEQSHPVYTEFAPITVDFAALQAKNPEVVGWIYSPDTPINYPIAQADDNSKYLYQLVDGTWNANGSIFLDFRNSSDFTDFMSTLHGHHMYNKAMFGSITDYKNQSYYDKHPVMYLLTPTQNYRIDIAAGRVVDINSIVYDCDFSGDNKNAIINTVYEESTFDSGLTCTPEDQLLMLSTCSYEFTNARYVLLGKMTKIG